MLKMVEMPSVYGPILNRRDEWSADSLKFGETGFLLLQEVLQISEIALSQHDLDIVESDGDDTRALTQSR
jgi:hypothetical protein